jgi:hypothetical protein
LGIPAFWAHKHAPDPDDTVNAAPACHQIINGARTCHAPAFVDNKPLCISVAHCRAPPGASASPGTSSQVPDIQAQDIGLRDLRRT